MDYSSILSIISANLRIKLIAIVFRHFQMLMQQQRELFQQDRLLERQQQGDLQQQPMIQVLVRKTQQQDRGKLLVVQVLVLAQVQVQALVPVLVPVRKIRQETSQQDQHPEQQQHREDFNQKSIDIQ